ncbi:hypothetical protein CEXT_408301 [Caerostris extrusa]|uniref:Uncharacterized protein n=1 Tax=Caerostris extrusa TaxID=172846 RepID=A0AAV4SCV3_CAEEX|nr:hypothetical protein CEXT_408301 [Caerostris extrusa]
MGLGKKKAGHLSRETFLHFYSTLLDPRQNLFLPIQRKSVKTRGPAEMGETRSSRGSHSDGKLHWVPTSRGGGGGDGIEKEFEISIQIYISRAHVRIQYGIINDFLIYYKVEDLGFFAQSGFSSASVSPPELEEKTSEAGSTTLSFKTSSESNSFEPPRLEASKPSPHEHED